jgi:hypothetical protein
MNTKTTLGIIGMAAAIALVISPSLITNVSAKITQETTPSQCVQPESGQTDVGATSCPGQSATKGQGHVFVPAEQTCKHNPSSTTSCPPGQNK